MKKPTLAEVKNYLDESNAFNFRGAELKIVSAHNHLIYRAEKNNAVYAIRMTNPESYRAREWISMGEEFEILRAIEKTGLGPKAYYLDKTFRVPFLIQEFVEADCFNILKPLSVYHLERAAWAIAQLNLADITPKALPFMSQYQEKSLMKSVFVWQARLADSVRRNIKKDVLGWAAKIAPLTARAAWKLSRYSYLFAGSKFFFHFDGAHCGNVYLRNGRAIFLDWQKVSLRSDPTFTLVRFMVSVEKNGEVSNFLFNTLLSSYLEVNLVKNFFEMAHARLLERQVSDLVWVLWNYTCRQDQRPVEEATNIAARYESVLNSIRSF